MKHITEKIAVGSIDRMNLWLLGTTVLDLQGDALRNFRESICNAELTVDIDPATGKTKITHIDGRAVAD